MCKWADDSQRFILEHFDVICDSPSQIYNFALPFSPSSSWLHKYYTPELLQVPKVVKGTKVEWGTCSRTVSLNGYPEDLSYQNNTIAVGLWGGDITILDTITGSQKASLSGHTSWVNSVAFSLDGRSLVSGSNDRTVKLWDVQTGGVVKTFHGHTDWVYSACISEDCTRIASGSRDHTICVWDIQTGDCLSTIEQEDAVFHVSFSPTDTQHIIPISDDRIWWWDVNGHQISSILSGSHITFSPDYAQFAVCNGKVVTVHQNSDSREIVAEFHVAEKETRHCCFSPDGRLIAAAASTIAYVWDITSPDPHPVEIFLGHTDEITSLVFSSPSSLISASLDQSVKFWKIGVLSTDPVATDPGSTSLTSPSIWSVSLQPRAGIAISSDADGVVKTWDLSTGHCKSSFQTPARVLFPGYEDAQMIDGKLIFVWYEDDDIHIWDTGKGKLLQKLYTSQPQGLRISGDGSKILSLGRGFIQAWAMWTWELVCEVKLELKGTPYLDSLYIDSSRVCVHYIDSPAQEGWDFGISGPSSVPFDPSTGRPHLDFIGGASWQTDGPCWIKNTVTGKEVFRLHGIYAKPRDVQWDGQYLVAGYWSGEVLIFDFDHMLSRDM